MEMGRTMINDEYVMTILAQGGIPLLIPSIPDRTHVARLLDMADGLLLSGGADLPEADDDFPWGEQGRRHYTESLLLERAFQKHLPMFGICRGLQQLNVFLGGTLIRDIPEERPNALMHHQHLPGNIPVHSIKFQGDSWIAGVLENKSIRVNSFHHQAIDQLARQLTAVAVAEDDLIEAVQYTGDSWAVAVQYHPERMQDDSSQQKLIREFIDVCKK